MPMRNISVVLSANTAALSAGLARGAAQVRTFAAEANTALLSTDKGMKQLSRTAGLVGVGIGVGIVAGFAAATMAAISFEKEMRNVNSILRVEGGGGQRNLTESEFQRTGNAIIDLSTRLPQSANVLANGLYDIASSGFQMNETLGDSSDAMMVLRASAVAASAGLTDTATSARGITAVLNAYGKSAAEAGHVSDVLFQTVNLGVVRFEDLANQLGDVVGSAAAAGVSIEQVGASFATMTLAGISSAESATSLNRVIQSLIDPSEAMSEAMYRLGISAEDLRDPAVGLSGVMKKLGADTGGSLEAIIELFPEIRSARGALALMSNEGRLLDETLEGFTDTTRLAGAAQRAFNEQSKSTAFQMQLARNEINAAGIDIGQVFLPAVASVSDFVANLVKGFGSLPGPVKVLVTGFVALAGAATLLAGAWLLLGQRAQMVATNFGILRAKAATLPTLMGALGVVATAAAAALTVYTLAAGASARAKQEQKDRILALVDAMKQEKLGIEGVIRAGSIKQLTDAQAVDIAERLRIDTEDLVDAMDGVPGAAERVRAAIEKIRTERSKGSGDPFAARNAEVAAGRSKELLEEDKILRLVTQSERDHAAAKKKLSDEEKLAGKEIDKTTGLTKDQVAKLEQLSATVTSAGSKINFLAIALAHLSGAQQSSLKSMASAAPTGAKVIAAIAEAQSQAERASGAGGGKSAAQRANDLEAASIGVQRAQLRLIDSQNELNRVRGQDRTEELTRAERDLAAAQDSTLRATLRLEDAQKALADARDPQRQARTVAEAEIALARARDRMGEGLFAVSDAQNEVNAARESGDPRAIAQAEARLREALSSVQEAQWAVVDSQKALAATRQEGGTIDTALALAELDLRDAQRASAQAASDVRASVESLQAARAAAVSNRAVIDAELDLREALLGVSTAYDAVQEAMKTNTGGSETVRSEFDAATVSLQAFQAELDKQTRAVTQWQDDLTALMTGTADDGRKASQTVVDFLSDMGVEGAGIVAKLRRSSDTEFDSMTATIERNALRSSQAYLAMLKEIDEKGGLSAESFEKTARAMQQEMGVSIEEARRLLRVYGGELAAAAALGSKNWGFAGVGGGAGGAASVMAKGGVDAHVVARPTVLYGERQTGGEAFIPRKGISRKRAASILSVAAGWHGIDLAMAKGGVAGYPLPPSFDHVARAPGIPSGRLANLWFEAAAERAQLPPGGGGSALLVQVGRALQAMGFRVGEHPMFGGVQGRHTPTSYHYRGRAIDVNWGAPGRSGAEAAKLDELSGQLRAAYGSRILELLWRTAGHFDHLHLAMAKGGVLPVRSYDSGGYLPTGTSVAVNGTGRPEPVGHHLAQQPAGSTYNAPLVSVSVQVSAEVGADAGHLAREIRQQVEPVVAGAMRSLSVELEQS